MRLKNLPKDAAVGLSVATSGTVDLIFVHQDELKRFPAAVNPLFQGTEETGFQRRHSGVGRLFRDIRQPAREGNPVRILIRAERPRPADPAPPSPGTKRKNETEL